MNQKQIKLISGSNNYYLRNDHIKNLKNSHIKIPPIPPVI